MNTATHTARRLYRALSEHDGQALFDLLTEDFEVRVSDGMPDGVGGAHHGRVAMISDVWGRIDALCDLDVEPVQSWPSKAATVSSCSAATGARRARPTQASTPPSHTSSPCGTGR